MIRLAWRSAFAMTVFAMTGAALALTSCGPAPNSAASGPDAPSNAASVGPAGALPPSAPLPAMPDPDRDDRPDRVKADDFAAHLERQQTDLAATDAAFIQSVRATTQSGADPKGVLASYSGQIGDDIAALPGAPHLSGCFAKAQAPNAQAEAALAGMLADRRDKAAAVAAVTDRPVTLADFGALATDIATGAGAADARASLAAARASVAGCSDAAAAPDHHALAGAASQTQAPSPSAPVAGVASPPPTQAASPQTSPVHAPPPKKSGFFERLFGNQ